MDIMERVIKAIEGDYSLRPVVGEPHTPSEKRRMGKNQKRHITIKNGNVVEVVVMRLSHASMR